MGDYLTEDSLIGPVDGNISLEFIVKIKLDSERFGLKLP